MTGSRPTSRFEYVSTEVVDSCRNLHIANLCPSLGIMLFSADASCLFEVRSRSLGHHPQESTTSAASRSDTQQHAAAHKTPR